MMRRKTGSDKPNAERQWRADLTQRLTKVAIDLLDSGDSHSWRWSIGEAGYDDAHPNDALFHVTANLDAVTERAIERSQGFCASVLDLAKLTRDERHQIIERVAERQLREYLKRVAKWLIKAEHTLTEFALAVAALEGGEVLKLSRRITRGQRMPPGHPRKWLDRRILRAWLGSELPALLDREIDSAVPPPSSGRRSKDDENVRLFLRVLELRKDLKDAGEKRFLVKACRQAMDEYGIEYGAQGLRNYRKRFDKGSKLASAWGLV
jgi:hypothetical protein